MPKEERFRLDGALGSLGWYEMWKLVALPTTVLIL